MKNLFYSLLSIGVLCGACTQSPNNLTGNLTEVESDSLIIRSMIPGNRESTITDTVAIKDGKFSATIPDSVVRYVYINELPTGNSMKAIRMNSMLIFTPGSKLNVTGTIENYTASGSAFYTEYNKAEKELEPLTKQMEAFMAKRNELKQSGAPEDSVKQAHESAVACWDSITQFKKAYIQNNPNSELSAFYFTQMPAQSADEYATLSDAVKNGVFGKMVKDANDRHEKFLAKEKAKELIQPGKPAPDFTLNNLEGQPFSLSSLKGKYVVLDFWGTWCGWCIKGIPDMKKYYDKYKSKVEFVSIDCGDTMDKWKEGVAKHEIPWINVYCPENSDLTTTYAIAGFPTKIILDKEGNIVKVVVGESPEFYEALDQLMKTAK